MRVVVAPDKFAGTLSATEAAQAIRTGWLQAAPHAEVVVLPLSDGGPGLLGVLDAAVGGERVPVLVPDPLGRPVPAELLVTPDAVYVESALAIGLALLDPAERDPEVASSAGLGELLQAALAFPERRIVVGLGGSATVDGGRGMYEALGGDLEALRSRELVALCDVDNPLLGLSGAAAVFGPQKGATPSAVQRLDAVLRSWAAAQHLPAGAPGAGAAGGIGAALLGLGATTRPGAAEVLTLAGLPGRVAAADLVLTGEGAYDFTSLRGKVVAGVAAAAAAEAVPCLVLAGQVTVGRREMLAAGVSAAYPLAEEAGSAQRAVAEAEATLVRLAARVATQWDPSGRASE